MKRPILTLVGLSAALLSAGYALGQGKSKSAPAAAPAPAAATQPAPAKTKLVRIATLNSAEANREFQANVQLLQAQRQAALELNAAIEKEKDAKKQKELKTQLDTLMAKLNENNAQMQKIYGFSLTRNYTLEIETAHIYLHATEEEAAQIEKAQAQTPVPAKPQKSAKK